MKVRAVRPSTQFPCRRSSRRRGAVSLEFVIIAAVVSLALVGAFKYYGRAVRKAISHSVTHPTPAYNEKTRTGGALRNM